MRAASAELASDGDRGTCQGAAHLPRPVSALRIWNVEKQQYEVVDPTLDGMTEDLNGDLFADGADLSTLLSAWGPCP